MKSHWYLTLCVSLMLIALPCCNKEVDFEFPEEDLLQDYSFMILGEKLPDPYSVENMRIAYLAMKAENPEIPEIDLYPSHSYIRFIPENQGELDLLKKDTTLVLFDYPLDYEINVPGTYYKDPSGNSVTYQYCVVEKDRDLPDIKYELLYEVLLPDSRTSKNDNIDFYDKLEYESVRLTGNLPEKEVVSKGLLPSKWTPTGTLRTWDDVLGFIPLEGASVHVRWFTHIEKDMTDENGYFETGRFRFKVNYSIKWERGDFDIRNGFLLQAWYNGPKKKGSWDLDITGGESLMYATIHRAACKHFYGDNLGLNRPSLPFSRKTKICYMNRYGTGAFLGDIDATGIFPDIKIFGRDRNGSFRRTDRIFGIASHELGHQAHSLMMSNVKFWQVSKIIYESWAEAVEWTFTNNEYNRLGKKYIDPSFEYNYPYSNQFKWPNVESKEYSPIFIDLIDNINQRMAKGSEFPNDMVTGYSLEEINLKILGNTYGLKGLYDAVRQYRVEKVTDSQIDQLFEFYW